jgi:putative Mg2+ transporter-C (MgtC) family protein
MDIEIIIRFLLAALWGGLVGAEREYRSKSAGFRTMIMISIGACLFTMMSALIGSTGNPDRIASNIVTGIGFLGAGVIFRGENKVNGITTAATIWAVAAVGMGIGAGQYFAAGCASVLILMVLALLSYFETVIDRWNQSRTYTIHCRFSNQIVALLETTFREHGLKYNLLNQTKDGDDLMLRWMAQGHAKNHEKFIQAALNETLINRFEY